MTEINDSVEGYEEFDIRVFIRSILKRWKIVLVLSILGGIIGGVIFFTNKDVYKASATVFLNSETTLYSITPQYLIQSEAIRDSVLETTGLKREDLPTLSFIVDKNEKNIVTIIARSESQNLAVEVVNAWAEASQSYANQTDTLLETDVENAAIELDKLEAELSEFLAKSGLQDLSWVEMLAITGGGDTSNIAILESSRPLPLVPLTKRNEIKNYVRKISLSQWKYNDLSKQLITRRYSINQNSYVLNHAQTAEKDSSLLQKVTIPIGAVLGFFIAIFYILLANWWGADENPTSGKPK